MSMPIIVIQKHRLGDIVMTFPLLIWLRRLHPDSQIFVVAEQMFFEPLKQISPNVSYISWSSRFCLCGEEYLMVINASQGHEAAEFAGLLLSQQKFGMTLDHDKCLRITGAWQLYRHSICGNSFHNRFHWSELNALDAVGFNLISNTAFSHTRRDNSVSGAVGIIVSASQTSKSLPVDFIARLASELIKRKMRPILLGGAGDVIVAGKIKSLCAHIVEDYCGKFTIDELMDKFNNLDLLITPDTGPMHLAGWGGLKTLNLSMGPVNPWDTGPYYTGHYVLRGNISCRYCWGCVRESNVCTDFFDPVGVAHVAWRLVSSQNRLHKIVTPKLTLYKTGRNKIGLYDLTLLSGHKTIPDYLSQIWNNIFLIYMGKPCKEMLAEAWEELSTHHPLAAKKFKSSVLSFISSLVPLLGNSTTLVGNDLFIAQPPSMRPGASFVKAILENEDDSRESRRKCLFLIEIMSDLV